MLGKQTINYCNERLTAYLRFDDHIGMVDALQCVCVCVCMYKCVCVWTCLCG